MPREWEGRGTPPLVKLRRSPGIPARTGIPELRAATGTPELRAATGT